MQPDRMLMADQPWQARARAHVVVLCLWALLVAAAAMAMAGRVSSCWGDACVDFCSAKCCDQNWP